MFSVAVVETDDFSEELFFRSHLQLITWDDQLSTTSVMVSNCVRDLVDEAELELAEDPREEENADNFHFMIYFEAKLCLYTPFRSSKEGYEGAV